MHYEPSHSVIFREGVFVNSREQPVFDDLHRYDWELEGTGLMVGLPRECTPVVCWDFAPKVDPDLINRSSDLVNRLRQLCMCDGDDVLSLCVSLGLFDRTLSHPALSYMGILVVASVRIEVSGQILSSMGDSVRAGSCLMVSVDTGDGDRFPVTMAARSLAGAPGVVVGCNS